MKVVSDGTAYGTHAYTDDGHEIERVQSISWEVGSRGAALIMIRSVNASLEVRGVHIARRARNLQFSIMPILFALGMLCGMAALAIGYKDISIIIGLGICTISLVMAMYLSYRLDKLMKKSMDVLD